MNVAGRKGSGTERCGQQTAVRSVLATTGDLFCDAYCKDTPDEDNSLLLHKEMMKILSCGGKPWALGDPHVDQMAKKYLFIPGSSVRFEHTEQDVFSSPNKQEPDSQ